MSTRGEDGRIRSSVDRHGLLELARVIARDAATVRPVKMLRQREYDDARTGAWETAPSASATCSRLGMSWRQLLDEISHDDGALAEQRVALAGRRRPTPVPSAAAVSVELRRVALALGQQTFSPREFNKAAEVLRANGEEVESADRIYRSLRREQLTWDDGLERAGLKRRPTPQAQEPGVGRVEATDLFIDQMGVFPGRGNLRRWGHLVGIRVASHSHSDLTPGELWQQVHDRRAARGLHTPPHGGSSLQRLDWSKAQPLNSRAGQLVGREVWTLQRVRDGLDLALEQAIAQGCSLTQTRLAQLAAEDPRIPHPSKVQSVGRASGYRQPLHDLRAEALRRCQRSSVES